MKRANNFEITGNCVADAKIIIAVIIEKKQYLALQ